MLVAFKQETQISIYLVPDYPRLNNHVYFFLHINSAIAMGIVQYLQVVLFVFIYFFVTYISITT